MEVVRTETAATVALGAEIPTTDLVIAFAEQILVVLLEHTCNDAMAFIDCFTTFLRFEALL